MANFMQDVGNFLTGGSLGDFGSAALIPSMATAAQQWQQAGQYQDLGNQAAERADPFGQYRRGYGDQLQALYNDPSQIANTPGYKFTMDQALDNTQARLASQGFLGSSQMQQALAAQAAGLASQTWNQERNALANLAGAQFDPANAARMQMEGGKLKMDAQSNALGALMYPFGPGAGGGNVYNNGGGGNGGGMRMPGGGMQMPGGSSTWFQRAAQSAGPGGIIQGGGTAMNLLNKWLTSPGDLSPGDIQLLQSMGIDTGIDTGGMDFAGGGYDPSGFGGYGDAAGDPTLQGIGFGDPNFSIFDNPLGGGYDFMPNIDDPGFDMTGFQDTNLFDGGGFDFGGGVDFGDLFDF